MDEHNAWSDRDFDEDPFVAGGVVRAGFTGIASATTDERLGFLLG